MLVRKLTLVSAPVYQLFTRRGCSVYAERPPRRSARPATQPRGGLVDSAEQPATLGTQPGDNVVNVAQPGPVNQGLSAQARPIFAGRVLSWSGGGSVHAATTPGSPVPPVPEPPDPEVPTTELPDAELPDPEPPDWAGDGEGVLCGDAVEVLAGFGEVVPAGLVSQAAVIKPIPSSAQRAGMARKGPMPLRRQKDPAAAPFSGESAG
jgi:hypothetical protein